MGFSKIHLPWQILLFVSTGTGIGVGTGSLFSSKNKEKDILVKKPEEKKIEHEIKSEDKQIPKQIKKVVNKPQPEDFAWEFVLFDHQGVKKCGAGNGEWSTWGMKRKDCSTDWMKKYSGKEGESSKIWMKVKDSSFNNMWNWAWQHLKVIWNLEKKTKEVPNCVPSIENSEDGKLSWGLWSCTVENN